jgi:hypothetical protein
MAKDDDINRSDFIDVALTLRPHASMFNYIRLLMEVVEDEVMLGLFGAGAALVPTAAMQRRFDTMMDDPQTAKMLEQTGYTPHSSAITGADPFMVLTSPSFYESISPEQALYVTCHELAHRLLCDPFWLARIKFNEHVVGLPVDEDIAQRAMDARVNNLLDTSNYLAGQAGAKKNPCGEVAPGAFTHDKITWDMTQDEAYEILYQHVHGSGSGRKPKYGPGGGARGHVPGRRRAPAGGDGDLPWGKVLPYEGDPDKPEEQPGGAEFNRVQAQAQARAAASIQHAEGRGTLPAGLARGLLALVQPPMDMTAMIRVSIQSYMPGFKELNGFIDKRGQAQIYRQRHHLKTEARSSVQGDHVRTDTSHKTWADGTSAHGRGSAGRKLYPVVDPAYVNETCGPVIAIADTSGSMGTRDLQKAFSAPADVLDKAKPSKMYLIQVDAEVATEQEVFSPEEFAQIECKGGGGTDMRVGVARVEQMIREGLIEMPEIVFIATDGDTPWPETETEFPICAVITRKSHPTPEWMHRIDWIG